jgi:AAA family ATP:ADP antiporter
VDTAAPAAVPDYHRAVVSDSSAPTAGRSAAAILAGAAAGSHLAGAAADAWFLAAIGPGRLGLAVAGSSFLVALVVAAVGGLADRRDRQRTLVALAGGGAVALAAIAGLHQAAPRATAVIAFVCVKQLQAAVELAFWVAVSEWFDARTLRRLVPRLAAASGVGGVVGAALVAPIARAAGTGVLFATGAAAFALVAMIAARAPATRRVGAALAGRARGSWADSLAALQRQPLARGLAGLVAIAGVAASLTYGALGAAAAAHHADDARALAAFLGAVRMIGQLAMIGAQVIIAPRLLGRLGVGGALVVAPLTACLGALGVVASGSLTAAALLQIQARITDGAIEGPAEKLAQNLLPVELRGRLGGWLEGPAKRTGTIVGRLAAGAVAADRLGVGARDRAGVARGRAGGARAPAAVGAGRWRGRPVATSRWRSAGAPRAAWCRRSPSAIRPAPPRSRPGCTATASTRGRSCASCTATRPPPGARCSTRWRARYRRARSIRRPRRRWRPRPTTATTSSAPGCR